MTFELNDVLELLPRYLMSLHVLDTKGTEQHSFTLQALLVLEIFVHIGHTQLPERFGKVASLIELVDMVVQLSVWELQYVSRSTGFSFRE
jgi:hypothetical protein